MAHPVKNKIQNNPVKTEAESPDCPFDLKQYDLHKDMIAYVMGNLFLRHLNFLYREFEGDLIMPIVLGEIAHHNVTHFYSHQGKTIDVKKRIGRPPDWAKKMQPTNAYSISEATGIPRETVRRKIDKLIKNGWIIKSENSEVTISETVSDHFTEDFNKRTLAELLETSECLKQVLGLD